MAAISNDQSEIIRILTRDRVRVRRVGGPSPLRNPLVAMAAVVMLFGVLALLYLTQTSSLVDTNYNIAKLQEEQARWQASNEQLELEIAELQSTDRLQREATARGMIKPKQFFYVQVKPVTGTKPVATQAEQDTPGSPFLELWNNLVRWFQRAMGA